MSKARLEQIERELADLDTKAMAFDHEEAEQCKLALVRIAQKASELCETVKVDPARDDQKAKGPQANNEAMAQEAARDASRRSR